jgi:hypothetical protein
MWRIWPRYGFLGGFLSGFLSGFLGVVLGRIWPRGFRVVPMRFLLLSMVWFFNTKTAFAVIDFIFISRSLVLLRDAVLNGLLNVEVGILVDGNRGTILHKGVGLKKEELNL